MLYYVLFNIILVISKIDSFRLFFLFYCHYIICPCILCIHLHIVYSRLVDIPCLRAATTVYMVYLCFSQFYVITICIIYFMIIINYQLLDHYTRMSRSVVTIYNNLDSIFSSYLKFFERYMQPRFVNYIHTIPSNVFLSCSYNIY